MDPQPASPVSPADAGRPYLIADLPDHERPRERLMQAGAAALSDAELIAILLRSGPVGRSTLDLARDLLQQFHHDLEALAVAAPPELCCVKGIGPAKACELKAAFELARRLALQLQRRRPHAGTPAEVAAFLRPVFRGKLQEELHALLLDNRNGVIRDVTVTVGLLDRSQAHPREVFRPAIQHGAAKIILAHNHPSGDPTPSRHDLDFTKNLVAAGKVIGIEVADHVVFGAANEIRQYDFLSFREYGMM